jgi:addiction module HigA family antidote
LIGQIATNSPIRIRASFLKEEFLNEIGMSQNQLAEALGVPGNRIHAIVNGTRDVTADTDLRLCRFFGLSEGYFLRL